MPSETLRFVNLFVVGILSIKSAVDTDIDIFFSSDKFALLPLIVNKGVTRIEAFAPTITDSELMKKFVSKL